LDEGGKTMNNEKWLIVNGGEKMVNGRRLMVDVKQIINLFTTKLVIMIILFLMIEVKAQPIDSLIAEALKNNPQLKSLHYKINVSEKRSESVNTLPAPNFSVEFSQVPLSTIDIWNQSVSNNFSLSQMFPLGGKLNSMAEVERKNTLIEGNNYDIYKINLIASIKSSYYSIWLTERKIEIQKKNITLYKQTESSRSPNTSK
jgi:hypothetical protein